MKKRNFVQIIAGMALLTALMACSESDKLMFDEPASVYFNTGQWGGDFSYTNTDTTFYSFFGQVVTKTTATTTIIMMVSGYKSDRDRIVNLVPDPGSTLQQGEDYEFPKAVVVPADSLEAWIPITFKRTEKLKSGVYWVRFNVGESDDFKPGFEDHCTLKFSLTELPVKPPIWNVQYYGSYSVAKLRFIYSIVPDWKWDGNAPYHMAMSIRLRRALILYERENGPLYGRAEDGEANVRVTFPR